MKKIIIVLGLFISTTTFGQISNDKIMFVIDSIPIVDDPGEGNDILESDVADIIVIKNKDTLQRLGYGKYDGLTFIFTKEYRSRPDSIKLIPSSLQMQCKDYVFLLHGNPYSGRFIDYYYSGRRQGEGVLINGKVDGLRTIYYQNGNLRVQKIYKDGYENGWDKEYYDDGILRQEGEFLNGKEQGVWEEYFPNGQLKLHSFYKNGELTDSAFKYYSTGKMKERVFIKDGKVSLDPKLKRINQLMTKSDDSNTQGDIKAAIRYCSKVIELDSTYADAYFSRGTIKLNDFLFDEAIVDLDKALEYEPFMEVALSNRAFARIRKYQFANSRLLKKNKDVTVLASKDKLSIPVEEKERICDDLNKALLLGDKSKMIAEALSSFCPAKSSR